DLVSIRISCRCRAIDASDGRISGNPISECHICRSEIVPNSRAIGCGAGCCKLALLGTATPGILHANGHWRENVLRSQPVHVVRVGTYCKISHRLSAISVIAGSTAAINCQEADECGSLVLPTPIY